MITDLDIASNSCKDKILSNILFKPITFMKLVSESNCASETVEKYLSIHLTNENICQKKRVNLEYYILQN